MNRRDFLKLAAAAPVAAVVPAIAFEEAPALTESALEQMLIDLSSIAPPLAVRPTRLICPAAFREALEPILKKHFDEAYAGLPDA